MKQPPDTIPLNSQDRLFLIPETTDVESTYFPDTIVRVTFFKAPLKRQALVDALIRVDRALPQLRLMYKINFKRLRLDKIPDSERETYFNSIVQELESDDHHDDVLAELVRTNNTPESALINIFYRDQQLFVRFMHVTGDAQYLMTFTYYYFNALLFPDKFDNLPLLADNYWTPLTKVVMDTPAQAFGVLSQFVSAVMAKITRFVGDTMLAGKQPDTPEQPLIEPIRTGSEVGAFTDVVQAEAINYLLDARKKVVDGMSISLNNFIQVEVALRLQKLGYLSSRVHYLIPVNLRRYLRDDSIYYPGNLISMVHTVVDETDVTKMLGTLQIETNRLYDNYEPLKGIPVEWVMNMLPRRFYDGLQRSWRLSTRRDPSRFFSISNTGSYDALYSGFLNHIEIPQYGATMPYGYAMNVFFSTLHGEGQLSAVYNPELISREDLIRVLDFNNQPILIMDEIKHT